jgi:hypothetical protein
MQPRFVFGGTLICVGPAVRAVCCPFLISLHTTQTDGLQDDPPFC